MPVSVEQALARATPLVLGTLTHPDYARTVQLATDWHDMRTGNISRFLSRFTPAETQADYNAKLNLTVTVVPALIAEASNPFLKVSRLKGAQVERRIDFADEPSDVERERRTEAFLAAVDNYYAAKPLEDYLSDVVVRSYALSDSNAWLLTEFGTFDFRTQKPRPYPVILPASAVVDFTESAGVFDSLTARVPVKRGDASGLRYTVYLANESLDFWPVLAVNGQLVPTMPEGMAVAGEIFTENRAQVWQYRILRHRAGRLPASRLGYLPDAETEGRTCVSPLEAVRCFLEKEIRTGSELDIVMARSVHPHKSQFVAACPGRPEDGGCTNGVATRVNNGQPGPCSLCHGTGSSQIATSAADVLTYPLPKTFDDIQKMPDLSKMVYFATPPIEVPKFQLEYSDHLRTRIFQVLFMSGKSTQTTGEATATQTATERLQDAEDKNIALSPFGDFISSTYVHHGYVNAAYVDVPALVLGYRLPANLLPPSLSDLMAQYDSAVKAGAGAEFLEPLYKQIVRQQLSDDPDTLRRLEVRWRFVSYVGVPVSQVQQWAALGYISVESRTLRIEQDRVFWELEQTEPNFYNLPIKAQQPLVDAKVKELVALLPGSAVGMARMSFGTASTVPAEPVTA